MRTSTKPTSPSAPLLIALALLAVHGATNALTPYGVHRDEFLYVAMGRHFALWRMDGPPLIGAIAAIETAIAGPSLFVLRFLPAIAGALIGLIAAMTARAMGGGRFAQTMTALAVGCNVMLLGSANLLQPVVFDQLWWTVALYATTRLVRDDRPPCWVLLGVAGGLGLLTKFIVAILAWSLVAAAALTRATRRPVPINWRGIALAAGLALAIGSPSLIGQLRLGFPLFGQLQELHHSQLTHITAIDWFLQIALLGPTSLLAAAGAIALIADTKLSEFRVVGLACAIAFTTILLLHGKHYYAGPVYPTLFAAGAVWLERRTARARMTSVVLTVLWGIQAAPFALPILPPPLMAHYAALLGVTLTLHTDKGEPVALPSDYADMLGWPQQVAAVARVYDTLSPAERQQTVILALNYGEAGALDFYGPRFGLPPALTNQGTYYLWGPGPRTGAIAIAIGPHRDRLAALYDTVTLAARIDEPRAVPEEQHLEIFLCRSAHETVQQLWPRLAGRY